MIRLYPKEISVYRSRLSSTKGHDSVGKKVELASEQKLFQENYLFFYKYTASIFVKTSVTKYRGWEIQMKRQWKMEKVQMVAIVLSAEGTTKRSLLDNFKQLDLKHLYKSDFVMTNLVSYS